MCPWCAGRTHARHHVTRGCGHHADPPSRPHLSTVRCCCLECNPTVWGRRGPPGATRPCPGPRRAAGGSGPLLAGRPGGEDGKEFVSREWPGVRNVSETWCAGTPPCCVAVRRRCSVWPQQNGRGVLQAVSLRVVCLERCCCWWHCMQEGMGDGHTLDRGGTPQGRGGREVSTWRDFDEYRTTPKCRMSWDSPPATHILHSFFEFAQPLAGPLTMSLACSPCRPSQTHRQLCMPLPRTPLARHTRTRCDEELSGWSRSPPLTGPATPAASPRLRFVRAPWYWRCRCRRLPLP